MRDTDQDAQVRDVILELTGFKCLRSWREIRGRQYEFRTSTGYATGGQLAEKYTLEDGKFFRLYDLLTAEKLEWLWVNERWTSCCFVEELPGRLSVSPVLWQSL